MENKKKELLKPKCDVVFQVLFAENKYNITQSLISDILGEKVEIIDIKTDSTIVRKYPTDKGGRLDLRTKRMKQRGIDLSDIVEMTGLIKENIEKI